MFVGMQLAADYRKLPANPEGFPALVKKLIALEHDPMAWEHNVKALKAAACRCVGHEGQIAAGTRGIQPAPDGRVT
jgi:hypothetical protein